MNRDSWNSDTSRRCRATLAAGVIILGSSGTMLAGPLPGKPIAIDSSVRPVQAGEDEAQAARDAAGRTPFEELNAALAAARAKLEELSSAAEIAAVTEELRAELQSARAENQRLAGELERARSALEALRTRLDAADAKLEERAEQLRQRSAREDALVETAERSAAQVTRLRQQLTAGEERLAALEREREEAQARMTELKEALSGALAETAQLRRRLSDTRDALGTAEEERDAARAAGEELRSRNQRLGQDLAAARAQADRLRAERADMEERLARLEEAADSATDAARANLLAMEDKIVSLNTVLAGVRGQEAGTGSTSARASNGDDGARDPAPASTFPMPPPATPAAGRAEVAARDREDGVGPGDRGSGSARRNDAREAEAGARGSDPPRRDERRSLARATDTLPLEERMQVQALLADLKVEPEERGLRLTVPGGMLFEMDSERVQETAHETLAKVAEVIDLYAGHDVLITGHTDAMGEAAYNEILSERRAALVKAFFVDNFDIDESRLRTRGLGEKYPIASNETPDGRRANRRVEVLILD